MFQCPWSICRHITAAESYVRMFDQVVAWFIHTPNLGFLTTVKPDPSSVQGDELISWTNCFQLGSMTKEP